VAVGLSVKVEGVLSGPDIVLNGCRDKETAVLTQRGLLQPEGGFKRTIKRLKMVEFSSL